MIKTTKYLTLIISLFAFSAVALGQNVLIKNATVMTATNGTKTNTDVLITDGKIARIGKNLRSSNARVIDATGKYVTPGHYRRSFTRDARRS